MNRSDRKRYKIILKEELFYDGLDNMSAKDIYHINEYNRKLEKKHDFYRKGLLYVGGFYILMSILNIVQSFAKFFDYPLVYILFILATLALLFFAYMTTRHNNYRIRSLQIVISTISPQKRKEVEEYVKSLKREKNIDSVLNS